MWLTPDAEGGIVSRPLYIPAEILPHVSGALILLTDPAQWEQFGALTPQQCADLASAMVADYYRGNPMIGAIVPYVTASIPDNALPCDGAVYPAADYQALFAVLADIYKDDPTHFHTPALDGRVLMGDAASIGSEGGQASVILTTAQMPSHDHADAGHTHSEIAAVATVINGGLEAPAAAATPFPTITGAGYAQILPTGGGEAHENRPPYHGVRFGLIFR